MGSSGGSGWKWLLVLLLVVGIGAVGFYFWQNRYPIRGIDVSHYQGKIDWGKVRRAGIRFVFIKATEGTSMVDSTFATNWKGAGAEDIPRGAYHFFRPNIDGKAQAEHFLKRIHLEAGDLPPVLDLEVTDDVTAVAIRREAKEWLETVEKATGMVPIIYTLPHYANSYLDSTFARYPLWVVDLTYLWPATARPWPAWTFWQNAHHGSVSGIDGDVDLNVYGGTEGDFRRLMR